MNSRIDRVPTAIAVLAFAAGVTTFVLSVAEDSRAGRGPAPSEVTASTRPFEDLSNAVPEERTARVPVEALARLFATARNTADSPRVTATPAEAVLDRGSGWRYVATALSARDRRVYLFAGAVTGQVLALTKGEWIDGWTIERVDETSFVLSDGKKRYEVLRTGGR